MAKAHSIQSAVQLNRHRVQPIPKPVAVPQAVQRDHIIDPYLAMAMNHWSGRPCEVVNSADISLRQEPDVV